jgi:hypothetical protein
MGDWLILLLLVPAIVAPVVLLVGFAGCKFEHGQISPNLSIDAAKGKSPNTVTLTWGYDTTQFVTFNFTRVKLPSRSETGTFTAAPQPASSGRSVQTMDDPDSLEPGTRYEYTVDGILGDGETVTSSPVEVTTFDISFLSNVQNTADQPAYTFPLVNFGVEDPTRRIIVAIAGRDAGTADLLITSVTIGGIAASEAVTAVSNGRRVALYIASVPAGSSGDIVIQFGNTSRWCGIGVWRATNFASDAPVKTATQIALAGNRRVDAGLTIPGGGGGLGYIAWSAAGMGGTPPTWTWTALTEDFDVTIEGDMGSSGARSLTAGSGPQTATASVDLGPTGGALVLAAWDQA